MLVNLTLAFVAVLAALPQIIPELNTSSDDVTHFVGLSPTGTIYTEFFFLEFCRLCVLLKRSVIRDVGRGLSSVTDFFHQRTIAVNHTHWR